MQPVLGLDRALGEAQCRVIGRLDPRHLDQEMLLDLVREYGEEIMQSKIEEIREMYATPDPHPAELDDWANVPMENIEEMLDLFVEPFYFGCEADDPMNAWAFNSKVNPLGAKLKAVFSSDIGHWDVPDMREVVEEAYELVEHELISEDDFRDFMFTNTVNLYGKVNPSSSMARPWSLRRESCWADKYPIPDWREK